MVITELPSCGRVEGGELESGRDGLDRVDVVARQLIQGAEGQVIGEHHAAGVVFGQFAGQRAGRQVPNQGEGAVDDQVTERRLRHPRFRSRQSTAGAESSSRRIAPSAECRTLVTIAAHSAGEAAASTAAPNRNRRR